jgi:hypothetical protein
VSAIAPGLLAGYREIVEPAWSTDTIHPGYTVDGPAGQCGVTAAWLQERLLADHGVTTLYCKGSVYRGTVLVSADHCWLAVARDGAVIDLTADQFPPGLTHVPTRALTADQVAHEPVQGRLAVLKEALS